ncbi:hypothetical protein [Diaminobutyricimonas sp. TR449]|uniref:membrane protein YczE n=1 Tax=Diaminobutyricimonas sp. TR449 TaxID=2708076 RepID=UPI001420A5E9|nr:hypothetical protein [Diaminobutyricimonas sp. TR449]
MLRRVAQLFIGLALFGLGIALLIRAEIGLPPWDVLAQGLSRQTGLPFGLFTVAISLVVLLLWIPLRERPGFGTVANALLVGPFIEVGLRFIPTQTVLWAQVLVFAAGLVITGLASGLYLGARFGSGPRDGLMTGLMRVTGRPIWVVRTAIELVALIAGWLLGGTVGVGTVAFALLIGPLMGFFLPRLRVPDAPGRRGR